MMPNAPYDNRAEDIAPELDAALLGVNERLAPALVPENYGCGASNYRFREGAADPRRGIVICPWGPNGSKWTVPYGGGRFADPATGLKWILVAADGGVWRTRPHNLATAIPWPNTEPALTAATFCGFVQGLNKIYLLRGDTLAPLVCENFNEGFKALPDADEAGLPAPASRFGLYFLNRFILVNDLDYAWASDPGTELFHLDSIFKINQGDGDKLVAVAAWNRDTLVCLKDTSVYLYQNASAGVATAQFRIGTTSYGCVAPRTVVAAGSDLYWLSEAGVASMKLTALNEEQGTTDMLSDDLPKTFARLTWTAKEAARFAVWGSFLYCALPADGSTVANVVAVYDLKNKAWCGVDESAALGVLDWVRFTWLGRDRLGFIGADGFIHLYEHGFEDDVYANGAVGCVPVATSFLSRGYAMTDPRRKRYQTARVRLSTWGPTYTIKTLLPGASDARTALANKTFNPVKWRGHGLADRTPNNTNDDATTGGREDYTQLTTSTGFYLKSGVNLDQHQDSEESVPLREEGAWTQVEITNTTGRAVVRSVLLEAREGTKAVANRN